ncbi:MAG: threonine/serine exporter family protein [Anaerostipes sp.]|nr:threonine/serine exporter family protein [Anaerostipes sp.]
MMTNLIQLLSAFLGAFGFSILFNLHGRKLYFASVGGLLSYGSYLLTAQWNGSDFIPYFSAAIVATAYAEIGARILRSPATVFLMAGIIPLVPGGSLYYTMQYAVTKQWHLFAPQGERTIIIAAALAAGIMMMSSAKRVYDGIRWHCKN